MNARLEKMAEEYALIINRVFINALKSAHIFGSKAALKMAAEACEQVRLSFPIAGAGIEVLRKYDACQACETAIRALMEDNK